MAARQVREPKTESSVSSRAPQGAIELLAEVIETLKGNGRLSSAKVARSWRSADLEIETEMWIVRLEGKVIPVTRKEFQILCILAAANGAPVPRKTLWSRSGDDTPNSSRSLDAHVWSLRRKIEKDPGKPRHLITLFRHGYRLE